MMFCTLCREEIETDENYYDSVDPKEFRRYHEECAPEDSIEEDELFLVEE